MAIGRHGQEDFINLQRAVWHGSFLQGSFKFDPNPVCPGNADGGCFFLLIWIGEPSCLFAEAGMVFQSTCLLAADCGLKQAP